jgi:acyl-CoA thioester hydrolase
MTPNKFSIPMTVRAGDLNYGNHVGYDQFFVYFQEARLAYLNQFGFSEWDIAGYGLVVAEATCKYKRELLHGDNLTVHCGVSKLKSKVFILTYQVLKGDTVCAEGSTIHVCLDRQTRRVVAVPQAFVETIRAFEGID